MIGPPALPFAGHAPAFLRDKLGFLSRCAAEFGDVVRLDIGGPTYLLTGLDDIKHVLVINSDNYEKTPRLTGTRARRFFGDGLVTARGAEHLRQRRMLRPVYHRGVIEGIGALMRRTVEEMLSRWEDGAEVDIHQEMLDLTQRIIIQALFGREPDPVLERAVSARRRYQEHLLGSLLPFADRIPARPKREYARAVRVLDEIIGHGAAERRADGTPGTDLLSLLVQATYEDGSRMTDLQIRDEVRTLAVAGYETIAEALTWAWYLLAGSPQVESALWAEIDRAEGDPPGAAHATGSPYCRMVLAESMRLYPPTWLFVRVAQHDDVLPSGAAVASGSKIYLCQWVMHRNPRYFPDPERFDPGRFTDEAVRARPRLAYLPFGGGRRLCIGEDFVWMEGTLILTLIARRFRIVPVPGQRIVADPNVTLRPRGGIRVPARQAMTGAAERGSIVMFDPGCFIPYYVDSLCRALSALGARARVVTSPPLFEPVDAEGRYDIDLFFFRSLRGSARTVVRRRSSIRQAVKGLSYPFGVLRTWRTVRGTAPGVFHLQWAPVPALDLALARAVKRRGWRVIYTVHDPLTASSRFAIRWQRDLIRLSDAIIVHTRQQSREVARFVPDAAGRVHVIAHGGSGFPVFDREARDRDRERLRIEPDRPVLLFFGQIKHYKGLEYLLAAMPGVLARFSARAARHRRRAIDAARRDRAADRCAGAWRSRVAAPRLRALGGCLVLSPGSGPAGGSICQRRRKRRRGAGAGIRPSGGGHARRRTSGVRRGRRVRVRHSAARSARDHRRDLPRSGRSRRAGRDGRARPAAPGPGERLV